jgi:hypothetical protein
MQRGVMCEVPPKLMQPQHEMLALALALLSKGLHPLPTAKAAAAAAAACCSANKLPPMPRLPLLQRHLSCCHSQTSTGLKLCHRQWCLRVPYTQKIVGLTVREVFFQLIFSEMVCRKRHRIQLITRKKIEKHIIFGKKMTFDLFFLN